MSEKLTGKKILLLSPSFFNYEHKIKNEMEKMGAAVDLYDERSVTGAFSRACLKICPNIFVGKTRAYYNSIIKLNADKDYDYILIVKADMIDCKTIDRLRKTYPRARLCLYLWDSIENIPNIYKKLNKFDIKSSFDINDCDKINDLKLRPLFFCDDYINENQQTKEYKYDITFCGTIHSDRYRIIRNIIKQCDERALSYYVFAYLQSRFIYYFYKAIKKEFRNAKPEDFSFEKKDQKEIAAVISDSKAIIDMQHPKQSGLTMRTIEMVGMKKKLITTNKTIKRYDFYNPDNICVVERDASEIDMEFLSSSYKDLAPEIYDKYKLERWIIDVLGIEEGV